LFYNIAHIMFSLEGTR